MICNHLSRFLQHMKRDIVTKDAHVTRDADVRTTRGARATIMRNAFPTRDALVTRDTRAKRDGWRAYDKEHSRDECRACGKNCTCDS